MKAIFLGTGAAEAIPSMFCRCSYCTKSRKKKGKDVRTRSSVKLGEFYQLDFGPDTSTQHIREGIDCFNLEHLMISHSHNDHMEFMEIFVKDCVVSQNNKPINIYLSYPAYKWLIKAFEAFGWSENYIKQKKIQYNFIPLEYYNSYQIGDFKADIVKGAHNANGDDEKSINYLLTMQNGRKLLYAVDTGWYIDETWEYLYKQNIDTLIMECTYGNRKMEDHPYGHLNVFSYVNMLDKMIKHGIISEKTKLYATHINHQHDMMHKDIVKFFAESSFEVTVAYDGLIFDI